MMAAGANVSLLPYAPLGISFPLAIPFPPPLGGGTVTWPKKQRQYQAPLIYTVILWYSFVVQSPPPPPCLTSVFVEQTKCLYWKGAV